MFAQFTRNRILILLLLVVRLILVGVGPSPARVDAAVSLLYFRALVDGESVLLQWATGTELDTAYFYLERAESSDGSYSMLDEIGLVPSAAPPDGLSGAQYEKRDQDGLVRGKTYWYVLVEVESSQGSENRTDPVSITLSQVDASPTNTATATATNVPTATPTQVFAGATLTATPSPTFTPLTAVQTRATSTLSQNFAPTTATPALQPAIEPVTDESVANLASQAVSLAQSPETPQPTGYPVPVPDADSSSIDELQNGYPSLPTPVLGGEDGYPSFTVPDRSANVTPLPSVGIRSQGADGAQNSQESNTATSPPLGTVFLWLGFVAALIIFVSAVTGSIYMFRRQRAGRR